MHKILLRAEVPLSRLHRGMPEEQLNLLKFAAGRPTQLRTGAPQIVRCDAGNPSRYRISLEQLPNDLFAQADALRLAGAVYGSEYVTSSDPSGGCPCIDCHLHPRRHRHRPDAAMLPNEVHDAPPAVPLLDVTESECGHFRPPKSAAD